MLNQIKHRFVRAVKIATCIAIIMFGVPATYEVIPVELKPSSIWEFTNSVLLLYLAIMVSLTTFSSSQVQKDDEK